jgi:acetyl esterase/lipase
MLKKTILSIIIIFIVCQISCSKSDGLIVEPQAPINLNYTKTTIVYNTINGVDSNLLSLDVYHFGQPSSSKPVVIYVHGGGFAIGDKANNMSNKQNLFSSLGYILISVNYRLSPSTISTDPNRIVFPTHSSDVADAIKWIYDNISNYGGNKNKIVLLGHSAGAQLVSLAGTSSQFLPARNIALNIIKGVASIDTEGYNFVARCNENNDVYLNAFGNTNINWTTASPINNLTIGTQYPKFFIAKRGTPNRISYSDDFISALQTVGVIVSQVTANQYDHEGINDALGAAGETAITEPLKIFFAQFFQ